MRVRYLGPSDGVFVEPYGRHRKGEVKEYPDEFGEELLGTSVKQKFEAMGVPKKKEAEKESAGEAEAEKVETGEPPIVLAARDAIKAGKVTKDGKPLVETMEEILGTDITAAERDEAWEKIEKGAIGEGQ